MEQIQLMHAKLHRIRVTDCHRDYVGSITIDRDLLDSVGMLALEEVNVVNISNGERWSTYILPGNAGSGIVSPNGGGALKAKPNDILIVFAFETKTRDDIKKNGHTARILIANENNEAKEVFYQRLSLTGELTTSHHPAGGSIVPTESYIKTSS